MSCVGCERIHPAVCTRCAEREAAARARTEERFTIVAWLRERAAQLLGSSESQALALHAAADGILDGDHRP